MLLNLCMQGRAAAAANVQQLPGGFFAVEDLRAHGVVRKDETLRGSMDLVSKYASQVQVGGTALAKALFTVRNGGSFVLTKRDLQQKASKKTAVAPSKNSLDVAGAPRHDLTRTCDACLLDWVSRAAVGRSSWLL